MKRFTDPLRKIVSIDAGAGADRLTFECGHSVVEDHRAKWGARARCHGCRIWKDEK